MQASIEATILALLERQYTDKKDSLMRITHWDGVDVIRNWDNPHERNRGGTIDILNLFNTYICNLLDFNIQDTGLPDCPVAKKKDTAIIQPIYKTTICQNKINSMRTSKKGKKLLLYSDYIRSKKIYELEHAGDKKKTEYTPIQGYITLITSGASIFYTEQTYPAFKDILKEQIIVKYEEEKEERNKKFNEINKSIEIHRDAIQDYTPKYPRFDLEIQELKKKK